MGGGSLQPDFKSFAALQNEPAKDRLNPKPKAEQAKPEQAPDGEAAEGTEKLTISMYQDPRDALDLERHQRSGIGGKHVRD